MKIVGDYSKIAKLDYQTDNTFHGNPMSVGLAILQMQNYLATGSDHGPLSQRYSLLKNGNISPWDQFDPNHGVSSASLIWEWCRSQGSCLMKTCPETTKRITSAMDVEAAKYKRPIGLMNLNDLPTFASAKQRMLDNPGDAMFVSTDGWGAYGFMGIDIPTNKVIALTFYKRTFIPPQISRFFGMVSPVKARIELLDDVQGEKLWKSQLEGQHYEPINYMAAFTYYNV